MSKVITLYNHKGGVSKTTSTFNLAHILAEKGFKVLVIDADPQCNMTEILLSQQISVLDKKAEESGTENELPGTSLLDILKPRLGGEIPEVDISQIKEINIKDRLDLIRGDVALNSIEDALAEAHNQRLANKIHERRTYVAIGDFLNRFGLEKGYDFILIDVGPSSGALTRSCFLSCDAFFVPVSPDRFNVQAIKTLSSIISRWWEEHNQIYDEFKEISLPVKRGMPVFLGTITQNFKISSGRPKPGYELWMSRIPITINNYLFPVLRRYSSETLDLTYGLSEESISVAEIPDFGSLAPLMQEHGKAVFQIAQEDTAVTGTRWTGATWIQAQERMTRFKDCFEKIVERLITL